MELYILRHMQTQYNLKGILQGRLDIGILPPGPDHPRAIAQNKRVIGPLENFDHILVSTLKRTRETAMIYGPEFSTDPLLDELDFGPWEGKKKSELIARQPLWNRHPERLTLGEPLTDLALRVAGFTAKYKAAGQVLAFGHGAWIRALVAWVKTGSIQSMNHLEVPNNEVMVIQISEEN